MTDKIEEAQRPKETKIYRDLDDIDKSLKRFRLQARVDANKQLTQTFQIENPFSSANDVWLNKYRGKKNPTDWSTQGGLTDEIFNHASDHWFQLKQRATTTSNLMLERDREPNFVNVVRTVTFASILPMMFFRAPPLGILFDSDREEDLDSNDNGSNVRSEEGGPNTLRDRRFKALEVCEKAAGLINELWVQSKKSEPNEVKAANEAELRLRLAQIFGTDYDESGRKNPLNFILPAFETSWRVILRIVLEIMFREMHERDEDGLKRKRTWSTVLEDAMNHFKVAEEQSQPTEKGKGEKPYVKGDCLRIKNNDLEISVHNIVREGLRLYPPMRRIHRLEESKDGSQETEHIFDIEYMQRDRWLNGNKFDPSRWRGIPDHQSTPELKQKVLWRPFGWGFRSCVAQKAGPTMLSVLVVAVVEALQSRNFKIQCKKEQSEQALHGEGPLVHDRKAYEDMILVTEDTEDDFSSARKSLELDEYGTKHGQSIGSKLPFREAEEHNNSTEG